MKRNSGFTLSLGVALAFVASLLLTVVAYFTRASSGTQYELVRLVLEDVSRRVEESARNLKSVTAMNASVSLSRARALAQLLVADPSVLKPGNRARFESLATLLGVDEIHVSDGRGVLVRSLPASYEGYDMASSAQSAAFLPAITNADFALVQNPMWKGIDNGRDAPEKRMFQYAGVARRDAPGIIQIGYAAERVAEAMRLASLDTIAKTTRIGREGHVRVTPLAETRGSPRIGAIERDADGCAEAVFEADCGDYRIAAMVPVAHPVLADAQTFETLVVVDFALLCLFLLALPTLRERLAGNLREIRAILFDEHGTVASFLKMFLSPLALATFAGFALVLAGLYLGSTRLARRNAEALLTASAEDIVEDLDDCVGAQLAYVGKTICARYGSPERMAGEDMSAIMKVYGLDELNAIDGRGVIVASNLPIVGDNQWEKSNPRKFNTALLEEDEGIYEQCFRESADEPGVWYKYVGVAFPPPAKGYLQLGFCRARICDSFDYALSEIAVGWHIGEHGFYVISKTSNGEILSTLDEKYQGESLARLGFDLFSARNIANIDSRDPVSNDFLGFDQINFFESDFDGKRYLCTTGVVNQFHRYVAMVPLSDIYGPALRLVGMTALLLFLALIFVDMFLLRLSGLVVRLRRFIAADQERQQTDLTLAQTIQTSALPVVFPDEPGYRIFARMDTAREVGGDFYDFYELPSGAIAFLIADVSGKGVPAALFMMRAKATLRASVVEHPDDLAAAIAETNDALADKNDAEMFVTAWIGLYDPATRVVTFVNAGHNFPLVRRADGSVEWLRTRGGIPLAAMGGLKYRTGTLALAPGDSLFLYTDGVTEAMTAAGEQYGEARLEAALRANTDGLFVTAIRESVTAFVAGAEPSDDITMLAFDVKGEAK